MTPELYQRLKPLYEAALDLPAGERAAFSAKACGNDIELRAALEEFLKNNDQQSPTLDKGLFDVRSLSFLENKELAEGEILLNQFRIVRLLGSGGMGDVYEAIDLELGRIALKTIRPALAQDPAILARFKEEVLLARPVSGPNVCRIYQLYVPPKASGCPCAAFLVMEYLEGETLADRIEKGGPAAPKEALTIATQLCAALQAIHDAGVIHRDLKPRNIMLVPRHGSEQVVVMDFGLARVASQDASAAETGITMPGHIMGTPDYMAPEQFEPGGKITPATDIYGLGIVLYELVTGLRPFSAHTPLGAAVRRGRQPDSPSSIRKGIPSVWDDVVCKCIEYEPERRYQSAAEVLAALRQRSLLVWRFNNGQRIALTPRVAAIVGAILLVLLSISVTSIYRIATTYHPSHTGKQWYDDGVAALRDGTYLKAANALGEAVKSDPHYALAHARLADAWAELDFTGQAQQEMLRATDAEQRTSMPDEDKQYVDAVQATLIRNYSAAAQDYEELLKQLPDDRRADGLVDLGRAYEKAGKIKETTASYEQAARLNPDDPAPFVHIGIWKSRQRDPAGADVAFTRAEELYRAKSNQEGLAEVAYQRGYAANEAADSVHAHEYLEKSLSIARQINSPQMEARSLSQLCSVDYYDGKDDKAIEDANQAIKIAEENNLEYWKADGLMRLGNAHLHKQDYATAESYAQQALKLAKQSQHPRIEASADFTLASIRDQRRGNRDEQIAFAKEALQYYRDYGFLNMATACSILLVRAEEAKGDYAQALEDATEQLKLAEKTDSLASEEIAEEAVGVSFSGLEDYPAALSHFDKALQIGHTLHYAESFQEKHRADMLWRLGRYQDAEEMLARTLQDDGHRADTGGNVADTRATILLSRGKDAEALSTCRKALNDFPNLDADTIADFAQIEALAEARLGKLDQAKIEADRALALAKEVNEDAVGQAELVEAEVLLLSHSPTQALSFAQSANTYFSVKQEKESEWLSLLYMAEASKASGDREAGISAAKKAIDILAALEQSWSPIVFRQYGARPDLHEDIQHLNNLVHSA
jgi:eukaryotic-like serine/threonine-protein kinase